MPGPVLSLSYTYLIFGLLLVPKRESRIIPNMAVPRAMLLIIPATEAVARACARANWSKKDKTRPNPGIISDIFDLKPLLNEAAVPFLDAASSRRRGNRTIRVDPSSFSPRWF